MLQGIQELRGQECRASLYPYDLKKMLSSDWRPKADVPASPVLNWPRHWWTKACVWKPVRGSSFGQVRGCPDVWEVVRVLIGVEAQGDEAFRRAAKQTGLTAEQVRLALRYYADFQDEIDDWIRRVE